MIDEYITKVESAIKKAKTTDGKLIEKIFGIHGMSSRENRVLLNELLKETDKYLEIGVHKGSTFVSAMYENSGKGIAIDNFSEFGSVGENKPEFEKHCEQNGIKNYTLINNDCFNLTDEEKELVKDCNIYFYDGAHKFEDQEKAITYYFDLLANPFILIVDDYNHAPAVEGTKKGIELTNAVVHKEWILNSSTTEKSWHNALYVAIIGKP